MLNKRVRWFAIAVALGAAVGNGPFTRAEVAKDDPAWSDTVNGVQARITLDRDHVSNGTALISTRLYLKNVQNAANALPFAWTKAKLNFRVEDEHGKELPMVSMPYDGMVATPLDLVLPFKSELSFDITCSGAGIPGDELAMIDLGWNAQWVIPRDGKTYYMKATLEIPRVGNEPFWFGWFGKLEIPRVEIPTQAPAMDAATAGKLIDKLGPQMLGKDFQVSEEAERQLSLIDDPRVIPWYVKAVATNSYELKFAALDRLARFPDDAALPGVKIGLATQGDDLGNCTTTQVAAESAQGIRLCAADALVRSPNPEAKKLLLTMSEDSYYGVRLTVVHYLGTLNTADSHARLEQFSRDANDSVRGEALRYLNLPAPKAGSAGSPPAK